MKNEIIVDTTTIHGEPFKCRRIFESESQFKAWLKGHPKVMILIDDIWHKPMGFKNSIECTLKLIKGK